MTTHMQSIVIPELTELMNKFENEIKKAQAPESPPPGRKPPTPMGPLRMGGPIIGATAFGEVAAPYAGRLAATGTPPGIAAGAMLQLMAMTLGAGIGTYFSEELRNEMIKRNMSLGQTLTFPQIMDRISEEMNLEAKFTAGAGIATRAIGATYRGLLRRFGGIDRKMRLDARRIFDKFGIQQDLRTATRGEGLGGAIYTGYEKVVGRFPFMAKPFVKAAKRRIGEVTEAGQRLWLQIGPITHLVKRGHDLNRAVHKQFSVWDNNVRKNYKLARIASREAGAWLPARSGDPNNPYILDTFDQIKRDLRLEAPRLGKKVLKKPSVEPPGPKGKRGKLPASSPTVLFMKKWRNLTNMTMDEYIGFAEDWDKTISQIQAKTPGSPDVARMMQIKEGMETSFKDIRIGKMQDPQQIAKADEIRGMWMGADDYLVRGLNTFDNKVANLFGRAGKKGGKAFGRFGSTTPGTLNPDELGKIIDGVKSPKGIDQLFNMLIIHSPRAGKKLFEMSVASRISDAWQNASRVIKRGSEEFTTFDIDSFIKHLKLNQPQSAEFATLKHALKKTGVDIDDLLDFVNVAKGQLAPEIPRVSEFMARGATLAAGTSGPGGFVRRVLAPAAFVLSIPLTAFTTLFAGRRIGRIITDPSKLGLGKLILNPLIDVVKRRAAFARLRAVFQVEDDAEARSKVSPPNL
jgi:hypothetical protein